MKAKHHTNFLPDRVFSYFQKEWKVLLAVTISGLIYNIGLLAGPWFEGKMTGCLVDILKGADQFSDMLVLVLGYVTAIAIVQTARYIKRFYVRRFANNVNRRMKEILYASLVRKSRASLREEGNIINLRLDITHLYYPAKNSFQKGRLKRREIFTELLLYTLTT